MLERERESEADGAYTTRQPYEFPGDAKSADVHVMANSNLVSSGKAVFATDDQEIKHSEGGCYSPKEGLESAGDFGDAEVLEAKYTKEAVSSFFKYSCVFGE